MLAEDDFARAPGGVTRARVLHREHLRFDERRNFAWGGDEGGVGVGAAGELAFDGVDGAFGFVWSDEGRFDRLALVSKKLQWPLASIGSVLGRWDS